MSKEERADNNTSIIELLLLKYLDYYKEETHLDSIAEILGVKYKEIVNVLNALESKGYVAFDYNLGYYKTQQSGIHELEKNRIKKCTFSDLMEPRKGEKPIMDREPQYVEQVYMPDNLKDIAARML